MLLENAVGGLKMTEVTDIKQYAFDQQKRIQVLEQHNQKVAAENHQRGEEIKLLQSDNETHKQENKDLENKYREASQQA